MKRKWKKKKKMNDRNNIYECEYPVYLVCTEIFLLYIHIFIYC